MEEDTLRDNAHFDVCRLCLELSNKFDLISVNELGDLLFKAIPNLNLQLSPNPRVCITCSKIIISCDNLRRRSMCNQEIIKQFLESNDLQYVRLKDMIRAKEVCSTSTPYYEIHTETCNTATTKSLHKTRYQDIDNMEVTETTVEYLDSASSDEDIFNEECNNENNDKCSIQEKHTYRVYEEVSIEDVVMNWVPDDEQIKDVSVFIKKETKPTGIESSEISPTKFEPSPKKVKVELISDIRIPLGKHSIKEEAIKYHTSQKSDNTKAVEENSAFRCFQCSLVCLNSQDLTEHVKTYHVSRKSCNEGKYPCPMCGKSFKQKLHADGHLLNKHGDLDDILELVSSKIHFCVHCSYKTINNYNLKNHLLIKHKQSIGKKETLKKCPYCPYKSRNQGNLKTHMKRHNKDYLFPCCYCDHGFSQKVNLHSHYLNHHLSEIGDKVDQIITNQIYSCQKCNFKTLFKDKYQKHVEKIKCTQFLKNNSKECKTNNVKKEIAYEIVS